MTGGLGLAGYAVAAGLLAPVVLRRSWAWRAPRFALGLWLMLGLSWVAAVLAVLAAATPVQMTWRWHGTVGGMAQSGQGRPAAVLASLLAAAVLARLAGCLARTLALARRERRAHAAFLRAAGRPDHALGAVILEQDAPAAYCLPGRGQRVVVSAGAIAALRPAQLGAVLAHEHAHLRGRHHLLVATASALGRAFPFVPLLAQAGSEVPVLAEMAADDRAARRHERADLAAALVILATATARPAALTAHGPAAIARIQRLLAPPPRSRRPARIARLAAGTAALALPTAIACLPLITAACSVAARP
jgi:Zn-dependent protease with chaperone function